MKSNKVIEKIKNVLNLNEEVKIEQAKLDNGTVIEADAFEHLSGAPLHLLGGKVVEASDHLEILAASEELVDSRSLTR